MSKLQDDTSDGKTPISDDGYTVDALEILKRKYGISDEDIAIARSELAAEEDGCDSGPPGVPVDPDVNW